MPAARRIHELLDKEVVAGPNGEQIELDVYLDQTMPAVADWRERDDWRRHEAQLNSVRQFTAPVAGIDRHFLHEPGVGRREAVLGGKRPPCPARGNVGRSNVGNLCHQLVAHDS